MSPAIPPAAAPKPVAPPPPPTAGQPHASGWSWKPDPRSIGNAAELPEVTPPREHEGEGVVPGVAGDAKLPPVAVPDISNDPPVRIAQADAFFRRNPGFMMTGSVSDAARAVVGKVPVAGKQVDWMFGPSELGYGQLIHDQMQWQINSKRQPDNAWWMRMNHQLVEDPITAEAYVRAGREDELQGKSQQAWVKYVKASDAVRAALGVQPVPIDAKDVPPGSSAVGDAWKGASALSRLKADLVLKPQARKALWMAHKASLEVGRAAAGDIARAVNAKLPQEAEFMSSWANVVSYYAWLNPPATGAQALWAQHHVLPLEQVTDKASLPTARRLFVSALEKADHHYEDEIAPKAADAAA